MSLLNYPKSFKVFTLILALALLLPSAIKFLHVFESHQHEICDGEVNAHFHTLDLDCEFYKFKLNIPFTIPDNIVQQITYAEIKPVIPSQYSFLSDYQRLHFSRRGPPQINLI